MQRKESIDIGDVSSIQSDPNNENQNAIVETEDDSVVEKEESDHEITTGFSSPEYFQSPQVWVRLKEIEEPEASNHPQIAQADRNQITFFNPRSEEGIRYTLDNQILSAYTPLETNMEKIGNYSLNAVLEGFDASVISMGVSNSGKSQMFMGDQAEIGLAPTLFFKMVEETDQIENRQLFFSAWEVNYDDINDLMNSKTPSSELKVRRQKERGNYILNLEELEVRNLEDIQSFISELDDTRKHNSKSRGAGWHVFAKMRLLRPDDEDPDTIVESSLLCAHLKSTKRPGISGYKASKFYDKTQINKSYNTISSGISETISFMNNNLRGIDPQNEEFERKGLRIVSETPAFFGDSKLSAILGEALGGQCATTLILSFNSHGDESQYAASNQLMTLAEQTKQIFCFLKKKVLETDAKMIRNKIESLKKSLPKDTLANGHPLTDIQETIQTLEEKYSKAKSLGYCPSDDESEEPDDPPPMPVPPGPEWRKREVKSLKHGKRKTFYGRRGKRIIYTYKGQWAANQREGYGIYNSDKVIYDGYWENDKRCGHGTLWIKDDDYGKFRKVYSGEWKDNYKHGYGTLYYKSGEIYDGEFVTGKREGRGRLYLINGEVYSGEWMNDQYEGWGVIIEKNGNKFEGKFRAGQKNGPGTFYFNNKNKKLCGEWTDGVCTSGEFMKLEDTRN
eukprot:gb/GECH01007204.1/.p1 GENE.gb/GECH01007204.1/~~gb/GECH01007204.1/.p1  ORF type:complete len:678 (+),score=159.49 gb/GECH01007204.1/:1-2034(+)